MVTPVPISNTEVKRLSVDGTAWETVWESRTLPDYYLRASDHHCDGQRLFLFGQDAPLLTQIEKVNQPTFLRDIHFYRGSKTDP